MTPEPGSWLDPDPLRPSPSGIWTTSGYEGPSPERVERIRDVLERATQDGVTQVEDGSYTWRFQPLDEYVTTQPEARRSVVVPLVLLAAVLALGLVAWYVAVGR